MRKPRGTFVFLMATAAYWGSLYTYVPILSPYGEHLGASLGMLGFIVAAYGFSQLVLRIPTGIISDRLGRRRPFMWAGFVASIVAAYGMALAHTPMQLLVFRGVAGIAASMWVAFTVLYATYFHEEQTARSMSVMLFCSSTAQLLATFAGGWIAQAWGWQAPFAAAVALAFVGCIFTLFVSDNPVQKEQSVRLGALLSMGKSPHLLAVSLLAAFSQYITFVTVYGFTPSYAATLGATKAQLGTLTLVSSIPTAIASLLGGTWLTKRLTERQVVVGGFMLACAATLVIPFIQSLYPLYITQAVGGIGRGIVFPVLMALSIKTVSTDRKATAMGFFQSIYALGMTGGPAISGLLGEYVGMRGIFISAGLVGLAAGVGAWFVFQLLLQPKQRQKSTPTVGM